MVKKLKRPQGNVYAFSWEGMHFYGGGQKGKCDPSTVDLNIVLNSVDGIREWNPGQFSNIKRYLRDGKYLGIEWPNYGTLDWPREAYEELLQGIRNLQEGEMNILVSCLGGLGRTGTMLAIFAAILGKVYDPVSFIRKHYMKDAIETKAQQNLVLRIRGGQK